MKIRVIQSHTIRKERGFVERSAGEIVNVEAEEFAANLHERMEPAPPAIDKSKKAKAEKPKE